MTKNKCSDVDVMGPTNAPNTTGSGDILRVNLVTESVSEWVSEEKGGLWRCYAKALKPSPEYKMTFPFSTLGPRLNSQPIWWSVFTFFQIEMSLFWPGESLK